MLKWRVRQYPAAVRARVHRHTFSLVNYSDSLINKVKSFQENFEMFKRRLPSLVTLFGLAALQAQSPSYFSRITVDQNTSTYDTDEKTMLNVLGRSGELDLVIGRNPGNTSGLVWYEEPSGGPASGSWAKHVIDSAGGFYEGMATMEV